MAVSTPASTENGQGCGPEFRRWSRNGTWTRVLAALHRLARTAAGRAEASPSLLVIDSSLARGASNGGATFHVKGVSYGRMGRNGLWRWMLLVYLWPHWLYPRQCTRTRQALY